MASDDDTTPSFRIFEDPAEVRPLSNRSANLGRRAGPRGPVPNHPTGTRGQENLEPRRLSGLLENRRVAKIAVPNAERTMMVAGAGKPDERLVDMMKSLSKVGRGA